MGKLSRGLSSLFVSVLCAGFIFTGCVNMPTFITGAVTGPEKDKIIKVYTWEASLKDQNQKVVNAFEAKNPGIKVDLQYPVEDDNVLYTQKIDLMLLSGEVMDAVLESSVANCVNKVERKLYQPLDPFIKKEGINYNDVYSVNSKVGNSYYALPIDISPWFVMLNKSQLDEAGLQVPPMNWTWDDYRAYARKLTKGEGKDRIYGSYFHTFNNYGLMGVYSTKMDNAYYKQDGSLNFNDPNLKDWLKFRYDMENVDKTSVPLMDIKVSKLSYRSEYFSGKVSMMPIGSWMLAEIKDTTKWPHDFQTVFAPLPKWGKTGIEGRTFSDTKMFSIPTTAKNPKEAYRFIRYYTTQGAYIRAGGLTAEKKMDLKTIIPKIVGDDPDKLYDMKSLYSTFKNPRLELNTPITVPIYNSQINDLFINEMEKYLVSGETLDECISNLNILGNDIVQKAKQ